MIAAIEDYSEALRLKPGDADTLYGRALAYGYGRHYDLAIKDYDRALLISNPTLVDAFNNRGLEYARGGDYDRAIQDYDQAIRLSPRFASAFHNRSVAYARKAELAHAISDVVHYLWLKLSGLLGITWSRSAS